MGTVDALFSSLAWVQAKTIAFVWPWMLNFVCIHVVIEQPKVNIIMGQRRLDTCHTVSSKLCAMSAFFC